MPGGGPARPPAPLDARGPVKGERPRILVTGGTGQVGWELRRCLAPLGEVVAPPRDRLPLDDPAALRDAVRALAPDVIVNAGAYTAVDRAEQEPELAGRVNAAAPEVLAREAARTGGLLVHYSTDYVFDGGGRAPYAESDPCRPLGVYGRTKHAGEQAVQASGARHLVLRTSWVYGMRGGNFLRTILRLAREREELRIVDDQVGAPTWSRMLAEGTAAILARVAAAGGDGPWGVYHLAAGGETSWHGFARAIVELDPARHEQACRRVLPIPTREYPTPAARPAYSVLDGSRAAAAFGVRLPHWREQLVMAMEP